MTNDKFQLICDSNHFRTVKQVAAGAARTKGTPELVGGILTFPFDSYASGADHLLIYQADVVEVTASAASAELAAVNFNTLLGKLYWDDTAKKITTVSSGNTLCGRVLETKDLSGGVAAGATLRLELNPNV